MTPNEEYALRERVEVLTEEVSTLKRELGRQVKDTTAQALKRRFKLTGTEAKFLAVLYERPCRTITNAAMHATLYSDRPDGGPEVKIVDVYICKIRMKIGYDAIETEWGVGYRLTPAAFLICRHAVESYGQEAAA